LKFSGYYKISKQNIPPNSLDHKSNVPPKFIVEKDAKIKYHD